MASGLATSCSLNARTLNREGPSAFRLSVCAEPLQKGPVEGRHGWGLGGDGVACRPPLSLPALGQLTAALTV